MPYTFICDGWCDDTVHTGHPAIMGEFNEQWIKTTPQGGHVADAGYSEGDIVTLCGECVFELLLQT